MTFGTWESVLDNHEEALEHYGRTYTEKLVDHSIKTRLFFNTSRVLTRIGRYEESTDYCLKAIEWCLVEEHLWGLGELHYQIGFNFELMGECDEALPYLNISLYMVE